MPFPEAKRVIYKKNPLYRVICQLRFPPILKIDKELPADFQEKIRDAFPDFIEKEEPEIAIPQKLSGNFPAEILQNLSTRTVKNYEFTSKDGAWKVNLTRTFLALSAFRYRKREEFQSNLEKPLNALLEIYQPPYFSRIGLRYIDIIDRADLKVESVAWDELLNAPVLGLLSSKIVQASIKSYQAQYEISLDDDGSLAKMQTGLVEQEPDGKICYMVDTDFFSNKKTEITEAVGKLNSFHKKATNLIQWLITDRLKAAMEPEEIDE